MYLLKKKDLNLSISLKKDIIPIELDKIVFEEKNSFKNNLDKLTKEINKENFKKRSSILIIIKKIDSSLPGYVSKLKSMFNIIIAKGENPKINRFILESTQIDFLLDPQDKNTRDSTHHFNSGLNQVLIDILVQKSKKVLFSTNSFIFRDKIDYREIGKIQQNITMLEKKKVKYGFIQILENNNQKIQNSLTIYSFFKTNKKNYKINKSIFDEYIFK